MVAKITSPHSVKRALNYNEQKVQAGLASCIYAGNFLRDAKNLNFYHKLNRFQDLISLNQRSTKSNTLHISLNFDPSENLSKSALIAIACRYMDRIGFQDQPFLVYEHIDSGHPHIHIVTTNIKTDGARIDTFNIGRLKSEPARKDIEIEFGLIKAEGRKQKAEKLANEAGIQYGKAETKRSITNVLDQVLNHYNYTSLASLNAILKTFNVIADRGKEGGRIHKNKGLLFQILDSDGKKIGIPIKASSFYSNSTFLFLEQQFEENEMKRETYRQHLQLIIDFELSKNPKSLGELIIGLKKHDIDTILRQNDSGFIYGITFVDHNNKSVFNGSEIGKKYSIAAFQNRFPTRAKNSPQTLSNQQTGMSQDKSLRKNIRQNFKGAYSIAAASNQFIKNLLDVEIDDPRLQYPLIKKKRKRKRNFNLYK